MRRLTPIVLLALAATPSFAQEFTSVWLDIGSYHNVYNDIGSGKISDGVFGMEYPAVLRFSNHQHGKGFLIGVKNWTDEDGTEYPHFVERVGTPHGPSLVDTVGIPIQNKLIGKYPQPIVEVNGVKSTKRETRLDEIDPALPADRMVDNIHHTSIGITTRRKVYAYTHPYHDNYHLIEYEYCNTGNTDSDDDIELPNQILEEVYFFRWHRWRGAEQAAWLGSGDQAWGRYTVQDVVGDGHETYPVDFTAQYSWAAHELSSSSLLGYNNLGSALFSDEGERVAQGDSVGRLAGFTMAGRSSIHADKSTMDPSHDPDQPRTMAWINNESFIGNTKRLTHEEFYSQRILAEHIPFPGYLNEPGCTTCSGRLYPHMVDWVYRDDTLWGEASGDVIQGGVSASTGYGPYDMAPGECVNIVVSEGVAGLSFDAATKVGMAYKAAGPDRDNVPIEYDANGNTSINASPFDYDRVFVGTESQTKNQWVLSARDSLFQTFYRARDLYRASDQMRRYPIVEPPRPPTRFSVWSRERHIDLEWDAADAGPAVTAWEIYRADKWVDNLYSSGCLADLSIPCGYEHLATTPPETRTFADTTAAQGVSYFYYLQAVGEEQPADPLAISGTPAGALLKSGRYLTQTWDPATILFGVATEETGFAESLDLQVFPNPTDGEVKMTFQLAAPTEVGIELIDVSGRLVRRLGEGYRERGPQTVRLMTDGLASGVYLYRVRIGGEVRSGKLVVR